MKVFLLAALLSVSLTTSAQSRLYPHLFDLGEVTLEDSVFLHAQELNAQVLLEYDADRLLTPFVRQALAGAPATGDFAATYKNWETLHPNFSNWGSGSFRLDGHVGGHYLTALSLAYAATKDADTRALLKERLEHMIAVLKDCQQVFSDNTAGLKGYVGGYPDNTLWTTLYSGSLTTFNNCRGNVPFYTEHKVMAGLRDAYVYAGNQEARTMFLSLCDWAVSLIANISDTDLQSILDTEHGGVNEVLADAYALTGDQSYLTAAKRYSHQTMVSGMQTLSTTFLDSKHANTQVPKYIGFERIAQLSDNSTYRKAATNFWQDVTGNRTVCIGGNSVDEHFLPKANCSAYITNPNGPESCNTNNMLKLTEDLFADNSSATLADFYERAMYNHILSTQNPTTGGYVYFTSLRPQHYRMYSQVNQAMWCCVGTGMENHSKYGEFIYAHKGDTLFVNLFTASQLTDSTFGIRQETRFPYAQSSRIIVTKEGTYTMAIRKPSWVADGFAISVNGEAVSTASPVNAYVTVTRTFHEGDTVDISLPMTLSYEVCPNYTNYVALKYGPILLGAKTSTEGLAGQFAGEGRMDHCPSLGAQQSLTSAPMLIGDRATLIDSIYAIQPDSLLFGIRGGLLNSSRWNDLVLQPFYSIHEARYMVYWQSLTQSEWDAIKDQVEAEESALMRLEERTLDAISTGEQQSDAGHARTGNFETGTYSGEYYIDALKGNYFQYELETKGETRDVSLMVRYTTADNGRTCTISIDGQTFRTVTLNRTGSGFYNVEYPIDESLLTNADGTAKDTITVRFTASGSTPTPGVYYIRLLREYEGPHHYTFVPSQWVIGDAARVNSVAYPADGTIQVNGKTGSNNIALQMNTLYSDSFCVNADQNLFLIRGTQLRTGDGYSYLWWFNGANHATQVAPTYTYHATGSTNPYYFIWDISKSGLTDYWKADDDGLIYVGSNTKAFITCFGLTAATTAQGTAYISDINYYTPQQAVDQYPELSSLLGVTPTGISSPVALASPSAVYDLTGRPVLRPTHGIYIQNGKKIAK